MARISKQKLTSVRDKILHDGSFLEKEAFILKVSVDELIEQLESMYDGGKKNTQFKAVITNSKKN